MICNPTYRADSALSPKAVALAPVSADPDVDAVGTLIPHLKAASMADGFTAGTVSRPRRRSSSIPTPNRTRRCRKPDVMVDRALWNGVGKYKPQLARFIRLQKGGPGEAGDSEILARSRSKPLPPRSRKKGARPDW